MIRHPVKLLASDLDGTLLGPDTRVADRTAAALEAAAAAGIEVVVATGRSHWTALPILEELACVRWVICSNGATVYDRQRGEIAARRLLSAELVDLVVGRLRAAFPTVGLAWECATGLVQDERWMVNRVATNPAVVASSHEPVTSELDLMAGEIVKLLVAHDHLVTYEWLAAVLPHMPEGVSVSTSGAQFVEVTAIDATKAEALRQLCGQLGVNRAHTIAFGDHANDLAMLGWVGTGFAMANAAAHVLAEADAVAPHHAEHGVAQVIEALLGASAAGGLGSAGDGGVSAA